MESYTIKDFEARFTKSSEAINHIRKLESLDLSKYSDEEIEDLILNCFNIIPYSSVKIRQGKILIRARLCKDNKPFDKAEDIGPPPKESITTYGRANKPHEQIFYSASNTTLACLEVSQSLKSNSQYRTKIAHFTVGYWEVKEDLHLAGILDSPAVHKVRKDILEMYTKDKELLNMGYLKEDTVNANNLITQFFAEQFTKDNIKTEDDYKISCVYARLLNGANRLIAPAYQNEKFDGISYPSIAMKYKGDNQAIFIDSFKTKLKLINAIHGVGTNFDFTNGTFSSGVLHESESIENGIIKWKTKIYNSKK